ncbi:MAG: tetratricopeptide repeat protein [Hyphomicrobiales bacterium]
MRISETVATQLLSGLRVTLLTCVCVGSASASDLVPLKSGPGDVVGENGEGVIESVVEATKSAVREYLAGNKKNAVSALETAAKQGHAPALWKLARMNADGDGVPQNELKAYSYFSRLCDENADELPDSAIAPFIAASFNALGGYYLRGIANSAVKADPERAREMFSYSATYFGDRDAQYYLGKLYLDGVGGNRDVKQAVRWLNLSSEKGHRLSQATLGELLASGTAGSRQKARAIMWLTLASEGADPEKDGWILDLNRKIYAEASENDRIAAKAYLERWSSRKTATMAGSGVNPSYQP